MDDWSKFVAGASSDPRLLSPRLRRSLSAIKNVAEDRVQKIPASTSAWGLVTLACVLCSINLSGQTSRFPDTSVASSVTAEAGLLTGIGAGAAAGGRSSATRVELADGLSSNPILKGFANRHLRWQRWWHQRLYRVLAERCWAAKPRVQAAIEPLLYREVVAALRRKLEHGSDQERAAAAVALARTGHRGSASDLIFALERVPASVKPSVVLAFGVSGVDECRTTLAALVKDSRFGRGAVGARRSSVPLDVRCVAALALGMLMPKQDDLTLHEILIKPTRHPRDLHLAACIAVGLQGDRRIHRQVATHGDLPGKPIAAWSLCQVAESAYLKLLRQTDLDSSCRGHLLGSMARMLPQCEEAATIAEAWLTSDDVVLSRNAAIALGSLDSTDLKQRLATLWQRVRDRSDAASAGLALLSIGRIVDAEGLNDLLAVDNLNPALEPYLAFAITEAATRLKGVRKAAIIKLRVLVAESSKGDGLDLGAFCLALGLLDDQEASATFEEIAGGHAVDTVRSAATLSLGLLGKTSALATFWVGRAKREEGYLVHDGALSLALGAGVEALPELMMALARRQDGFTLGGIARALGLLNEAAAVPMLLKLAGTKEGTRETKAFAIGALGLLLDREPGATLERLRDLVPLPPDSQVLRDALDHL